MINTDLGRRQEWRAVKGFDNQFTLTFLNNGVAFDTSNYVFAVSIRKIGDSENVVELTEGDGVTNGGASGIVTILLNETDSNIVAKGYFYEITYVNGSFTNRLLQGTLNLVSQENQDNTNQSLTLNVSLSGTNVQLSLTLGGELGFINADYDTELQFNQDKDIFQDVDGTSPVFTLASSGNVNGVGIILRLNKPDGFTFPVNFEAHANSEAVDATKLNVINLVYFSNWDGEGTARVIYFNSLFDSI